MQRHYYRQRGKKLNIDNPLPSSIEFEKTIIATAILDEEFLNDVVELLKPEHFHSTDHRKIFKTIVDIHRSGEVADIVAVSSHLDSRGDKGACNVVLEIADCIVTAKTALSHTKTILEKKQLRDVIALASKITAEAMNPDASATMVIDLAAESLFKISNTENSETQFLSQSVLTSKTFENIEKRMRGEITGIKTGFESLDNNTGGFNSGELIIIAGRPSSGKTALAANIARNIAFNNVPVAFFELEMSSLQINERLLSAESEVNLMDIKTGTLTKKELTKLGSISGQIANLPLFISDTPRLTIASLLSKTRKLIRNFGIKIVFIDYLQLMSSELKQQNRNAEISEISRGLKLIAKTVNIPIIALSQLSRKNEQRENHEPQLSDLRDSGSIEQDADTVLFVHRECLYDETPENKDKANIFIRKQRNGNTGRLDICYKGTYCKFEDKLESNF